MKVDFVFMRFPEVADSAKEVLFSLYQIERCSNFYHLVVESLYNWHSLEDYLRETEAIF